MPVTYRAIDAGFIWVEAAAAAQENLIGTSRD